MNKAGAMKPAFSDPSAPLTICLAAIDSFCDALWLEHGLACAQALPCPGFDWDRRIARLYRGAQRRKGKLIQPTPIRVPALLRMGVARAPDRGGSNAENPRRQTAAAFSIASF